MRLLVQKRAIQNILGLDWESTTKNGFVELGLITLYGLYIPQNSAFF